MSKQQRTCTCAAYPFPHRAGGGACTDPGPAPAGCWECRDGRVIRDPFCTGDSWYTEIDCLAPECPWTDEEIENAIRRPTC